MGAGDRLGNRGDGINNPQEFWQNVHSEWYHGSCNGHWRPGARLDHPWAAWGITSAALGLTSWVDGSLFYDTGYYDYVNPFYDQSADDYSQPIVTTSAPTDFDAPPVMAAVAESDRARSAFYGADYSTSLEFAESALSSTPGDPVLHEFRALCLYALGRYKEAAGSLYAVLSVSPGWDWTTMSSLYPSVDAYTQQLRALEDYARQNPDSSDGHFVLAYHYMTQGHIDAAAMQLKEVGRLSPSDQLSRQLLAMISQPGGITDAVSAAPATTDVGSKKIPPEQMRGNWRAPTPGGGTVELSLGADDRFTWKYDHSQKAKAFDGKYDLAGVTIVLKYSNGGTMVAKINAEAEDRFSFKMVGGPANDPGLAFRQIKG
jgi:tetratricopeptide (TPR) repeat protein